MRGRDVPPLALQELRKLGEVTISVPDPHEHRPIEVLGVRATAVFDAAFGPAWRDAEEVVFTCLDGFHPAIPVRLFVERDAYFAYARVDAPFFAVTEEPSKRTPVGPYYVVWSKTDADDPPEPRWPYQVTAAEVTDFATRFAATMPPAGTDALAAVGFERFRTFCLPCHTINGRGGGVGPELNYPVSVTEYFAEPVLRSWIVDPRNVRWNAKMPPPLPPGADAGATVDAVVAYLRVMATHKIAPPPP
jgi:mono/diheme cytochrome c family protein